MELKLSSLHIIRNCVQLGYPVLESYLSTQEIADENIICVDPGFEQDLELGRRICEKFPKARLVEFRWPTNVPGDGSRIGIASNYALMQATGTHVLNVQADELYPEPLKNWLRDNWKDFVRAGYDCLRLKVLNTEHNAQFFQGGESWDGVKFDSEGRMTDVWNRGGLFNGTVGGAGYNVSIKFARKCPAIRFAHDAWQFENCATWFHPPISNEYPILHLHDFHRDSLVNLRRTAATDIWTDDRLGPMYKKSADDLEQSQEKWFNDPMWTNTHSPFEAMMPEWSRGVLGNTTYRVNYDLLSKW